MSYCFLVYFQSQSKELPTHCHIHYEATCLAEWYCAQCYGKYHDTLKSFGKTATDASFDQGESVVSVWSIRTCQMDQSSVALWQPVGCDAC